jgi:hypothetical protein
MQKISREDAQETQAQKSQRREVEDYVVAARKNKENKKQRWKPSRKSPYQKGFRRNGNERKKKKKKMR